MDGDRKYRQNGYQDSDRGSDAYRGDRPRQPGVKPPLDVTGPRLPRLVQNITAARCFNCSYALSPAMDFASTCPKCGVSLHCCKQCANFEPSTRFQCVKPIPARIPVKDQANTCSLFTPRVTVTRDALPATGGPATVKNDRAILATPRTATDARAAFDSLFKK